MKPVLVAVTVLALTGCAAQPTAVTPAPESPSAADISAPPAVSAPPPVAPVAPPPPPVITTSLGGSPAASSLLQRGDELTAAGRWTDALRTYDELLKRHASDPLAPGVRIRRDLVAQLLASRTEIERMAKETATYQAQITKMREELSAKDAEVARARRELNDRQGEAERLRADLERLKEIDLRLERPRP